MCWQNVRGCQNRERLDLKHLFSSLRITKILKGLCHGDVNTFHEICATIHNIYLQATFGKAFWQRWLHIFVNPREQFENVSLTFFSIFISIHFNR